MSERDYFELPPLRAELLIKKDKVLYAITSFKMRNVALPSRGSARLAADMHVKVAKKPSVLNFIWRGGRAEICA